MTTYERWFPGPNEADEFATMPGLKAAFTDDVFAKVIRPGAFWPGAPAGNYTPWDIVYFSNGGLPYLAVGWKDFATGHHLKLWIRFSSALVGMLDPFTWFPAIYAPLGTLTQAEWDEVGLHMSSNWMTEFPVKLYQAGLTRSPIAATRSILAYTYGARSGEYYGVDWRGTYNPNPAEQGDGITDSHFSAFILGTDADDGTIGLAQTTAGVGENYSQTPQLVAEQPDQASSWDGLGDATDGVKDEISNTLPKFDNIKDALDKAGITNQPETVTHATDVGGAGDLAADTPVPGYSIFGAPGAASAMASAGPPAIYALSKVPAIITAFCSMAAAVGAGIMSIGLLGAMKSGFNTLVSALPGIGTIATAVEQITTSLDSLDVTVTNLNDNTATQAEQTTAQTIALDRIAVALEAIQGELVGTAEDQLNDPGIITVTELASQARSELEVRTHGQHFIASTGTVVEES